MKRVLANLKDYQDEILRRLVYEQPKTSKSYHIRKALDLYFKTIEKEKEVNK